MTDKVAPVEPIKTLVTETPTGPKDGELIKTPPGQADVKVVTMTWYSQAGVRVLRTYLQGLVGFLIAAGTGAAAAVGVNMPVGDFGALFVQAASMAVAPAVVSALQNAIEILSKMDTGAPQLRA